MKYLNPLCLLLALTSPLTSFSYNETGEAIPDHYSEPCPDYTRWWFNLGLGAGSSFRTNGTEDISGASAQISFNGALSPRSMLTIYSNLVGADDWNHAADLGIMVGLVKREPNWYASASAGLCYYEVESSNNASSWPDYYHYSSQGVGIPFQVQAFWTPFRHFGVGVIGHVVASKDPYANALLAIQLRG